MSGTLRWAALTGILLAVLTGVLLVAFAGPATAAYAPAPEFNRGLTAEVQVGIVVMNRDEGTISLIPNIGLTGNAQNFCLLLPTPTVPTLEPMGQPIWWSAVNLTQPDALRRAKWDYGCGSDWQPDMMMPALRDDVAQILGPTVGPFVAEVLEADDVDALAAWLIDREFTLAIRDLNRFAPYLERGWVITAMSLDTARVHLSTWIDINVMPTRFTFEASQWELPLPILATGRSGSLPVAFFVIDDHRMTLPGFTTTYANVLNESEMRAIAEAHPDLAPVLETGRVLTRLDRTFIYADSMAASIVLERADSDDEIRRTTYYRGSPGGLPALLVGLGGLLLGARRFFRRRYGDTGSPAEKGDHCA